MSSTVTTLVITEHQLSDTDSVWTLTQVCERTRLSPGSVRDLVDLGLIAPVEPAEPERWRFHDRALARLQRARRLRHELELDWPGVAVALDLMEEVERLRREVRRLRSLSLREP